MKYSTDFAFRAALETRINDAARTASGPAIMRLRKLVVFDRLLARLLIAAPDRWVVKGGVALDLRLGDRARTTMDLDLTRQDGLAQAHDDLLDAAATDLGDYFLFGVEKTDEFDQGNSVAARYRAFSELAGRSFDTVTIDIGSGEPLPQSPDYLPGTDLLAFAEVPRLLVPSLPLERHVAEKLHAYTRTYEGGRGSTRVKDLADLNLIRGIPGIRRGLLKSAIDETFRRRGTHPVPARLPTPPDAWAMPFRRLVEALDLDPDLATGHRDVAAFLDPVLAQAVPDDAVWDPVSGSWSR
jgi:hypothetical protein